MRENQRMDSKEKRKSRGKRKKEEAREWIKEKRQGKERIAKRKIERER